MTFLIPKGILAKRPVFVDVTRKSGIDFKHTNGKSQRYFIVETLGSGVATFDYDNDGWIDIYFVNSGQVLHRSPKLTNVLYRNNGDGTFSSLCHDRTGGLTVTVGDSIGGGIVTNITKDKVLISLYLFINCS